MWRRWQHGKGKRCKVERNPGQCGCTILRCGHMHCVVKCGHMHCCTDSSVHWTGLTEHCRLCTVAEDSSGIFGIKTDPLFKVCPHLPQLYTPLVFAHIMKHWNVGGSMLWWEIWQRKVNYDFSINNNLLRSGSCWLSLEQSLKSHISQIHEYKYTDTKCKYTDTNTIIKSTNDKYTIKILRDKYTNTQWRYDYHLHQIWGSLSSYWKIPH